MLAGVSILQENQNYSPALSAICQILPQILPQLQGYSCLLTKGIDGSFFDMIWWEGGIAVPMSTWYAHTGWCLRGDVPPEGWKILYFCNWNRAI